MSNLNPYQPIQPHKVYTYANIRDWRRIQDGEREIGDESRWYRKPGLNASLRIGDIDEEARNTTGVFAFLEPLPDSWVHNTTFPYTWKRLKRDFYIDGLPRMLLEIKVDPETDPVFVFDVGHMEAFRGQGNADIPQKYLHNTQEEAERAYMASKVPLKEWLLKRDDLQYSLPEVIITEDVPIDRIAIAERQPLLEDNLRYPANKSVRMD